MPRPRSTRPTRGHPYLLGGALLAAACAGGGRAQSAYGGTISARSGPYQLDALDGHGNVLPTFAHAGQLYLLGSAGERYELRIRNRSDVRVEAVISVDGLDALDGKPASWSRGGYLVPAHGEVTIDGFRLSLGKVAAFRFSSVAGSYAAKTGDARNVGVLGVAIFPESPPVPPPPLCADDSAPYTEGSSEGATGAPAPRDHVSAHSARGPAPPSSRAEGNAEDQQAHRRPPPISAPPSSRAEGNAVDGVATSERPGLGTAFGEERVSPVVEVPFERANPDHPSAVLALRYDDRKGLLALGIDLRPPVDPLAADLSLRQTAEPFGEMPHDFSTPPPGWTPGDP